MRFSLRKKLLSIFAATATILLAGCGNRDSVTVLKLAHALEVLHPVHLGMVYMGKKVEEYSGGKMRIDIYPGGQLGAERELIELLQIGSLAMTKVSTAPLEAFVPEMQIFGMPYIFRDDDHRWKVLKSPIGKQLLLAGEPFFLRGLCYYDAGSRSFFSVDKAIRSPGDLKGLKIRVMKSITSVQMVQALGGSPTPIPFGELYTALQQGVVDGAENNPPSFYLAHHHEVSGYYSMDEHTSIPDILLIGTRVWNSLTEEEKGWLQTAVDESVEYQRALWQKATEEALEQIQKAGVEVIYPDKEPFLLAVQSMHESYRGTPIYDLMQKIKAVQ